MAWGGRPYLGNEDGLKHFGGGVLHLRTQTDTDTSFPSSPLTFFIVDFEKPNLIPF
jgi:hypothetical protein